MWDEADRYRGAPSHTRGPVGLDDPASAPDPASTLIGRKFGHCLQYLGEQRLRLSDEAGVEVQVISLSTPGLPNLGPERPILLARRIDDRIAEAVSHPPDRL